MTTKTTEERFSELARAINDALAYKSAAEWAAARYIYDANTEEGVLRRNSGAAKLESDAKLRELWTAFYDVASEVRAELATLAEESDAEFQAGVKLLNGEAIR